MRGQNTERMIEVIPATIDPLTRMSINSVAKRRVAGYARVSTDHDEQFTSFEARVDCTYHHVVIGSLLRYIRMRA